MTLVPVVVLPVVVVVLLVGALVTVALVSLDKLFRLPACAVGGRCFGADFGRIGSLQITKSKIISIQF